MPDAAFEETDPFFLFAEEYWIQPCFAQTPKYLHGLCMYGPAFIVIAFILSLALILVACEQRSKAKATAAEAESSKAKPKKTETKKTK